MSWSISCIGKPENVVKAIEDESAKLTGQCKIEFDDAKPHLIGLVRQTFETRGEIYGPPAIKLDASGSGQSVNGERVQRLCNVTIQPMWTKIVMLLLCALLSLGSVGCGESGPAKTKAYFGSPFGKHVVIETTAEQELHINKAGFSPATTTQPASWYVNDASVTNRVQGANQTIPLVIDANARYQAQLGLNATNIMDAAGRNFVQPLVGLGQNYLQMRSQFNTNATQLGMTKWQVASGLVQGIFGGQIDYTQVARNAEPGVKAIVDQRLTEMQADITEQRKAAEAQGATQASELKAITDKLDAIQKRLDEQPPPPKVEPSAGHAQVDQALKKQIRARHDQILQDDVLELAYWCANRSAAPAADEEHPPTVAELQKRGMVVDKVVCIAGDEKPPFGYSY